MIDDASEPAIKVIKIKNRCFRKALIKPPTGLNYDAPGKKVVFKTNNQGNNQGRKGKTLFTKLAHPCVHYDRYFLSDSEATSFFEELKDLQWNINQKTNRFTVLYGDPGVEYHYKDQPEVKVNSWTASLSAIRAKVRR